MAEIIESLKILERLTLHKVLVQALWETHPAGRLQQTAWELRNRNALARDLLLRSQTCRPKMPSAIMNERTASKEKLKAACKARAEWDDQFGPGRKKTKGEESDEVREAGEDCEKEEPEKAKPSLKRPAAASPAPEAKKKPAKASPAPKASHAPKASPAPKGQVHLYATRSHFVAWTGVCGKGQYKTFSFDSSKGSASQKKSEKAAWDWLRS